LLSHILVRETSLLRDSINHTLVGFQGAAHTRVWQCCCTEGGMDMAYGPGKWKRREKSSLERR